MYTKELAPVLVADFGSDRHLGDVHLDVCRCFVTTLRVQST